ATCLSFGYPCFFCQAEDGIRDRNVTGVQTCALPISARVLVLAGLGEQVELGIVGGVLRLCHGVLLEGQLRASMIAALKASRSSGVREVMRRKPAESSTTTSSSAQRPPALTRSVRMVGTEVSS